MCSVKSVGTLFIRNVSSNVSPSTHSFSTKLIFFSIFFTLSGQRTAASNGKDLTCVWCRARWIVARPSGSAGGVKRSMGAYGYINLSDVAGISPVRDTSTCKRAYFSECSLHSHFFRLSRSKERREVLWMTVIRIVRSVVWKHNKCGSSCTMHHDLLVIHLSYLFEISCFFSVNNFERGVPCLMRFQVTLQ